MDAVSGKRRAGKPGSDPANRTDRQVKRVLFAAGEVYPLIMTGGLAEVACFLPAALKARSYDVRIILPAYGDVLARKHPVERETRLRIPDTGEECILLQIRLPGHDLPVYLVDHPALFGRAGNPYLDSAGDPWPDNAARYALYCRAVREVAAGRAGLDWAPDVLHCNDWQTGLAPALLSLDAARPATVFTIHNLAHQGVFPGGYFASLGLPADFANFQSLEYHGGLSFMKGGLVYADKLATVSPSYAREITTPAFGAGLDGLLRHRGADLTGILNGVDYRLWDPRHDPMIDATYWINRPSGKKVNKQHLQRQFGLAADEQAIVVAFIGRLTHQKGSDIIIDNLDGILAHPDVQLVLLGSGDRGDERALLTAAAHNPGRMSVSIAYDEVLAHRIQAGADLLLMPSRFEPCGLTQLYAMRYGTIPIASLTGGLIDTIVDATDQTLEDHTATGFHFAPDRPASLTAALVRALHLYRTARPRWRQLMATAMKQEFSWDESARQYEKLYEEVTPAGRA